VPQSFIDAAEFTNIDFGAGNKVVLVWRTVPAEAASVRLQQIRVITGGEG